MNIRLSLFGYEVLSFSAGNDDQGQYIVLGGDFEAEQEYQTYGFELESNDGS